MKTVVLYGFRGVFSGNSEYEYAHPLVGDVHNCMLFIAQQNGNLDFEGAKQEALRYGFTELETLRGNPLLVETLNGDHGRKFAGFYEEAISSGSSLVYYPNT